MIRVSSSEYSIEAKGHAGYAPYGQDIICAAFSILMGTLAESVVKLDGENKLTCKEIKLDSGSAIISCVPKEEYREETKIIFNTIRNGITILSSQYAYYISVIQKK